MRPIRNVSMRAAGGLLLALGFLPRSAAALEMIFPIEGKGGLVQGYNPRRSGEENLKSFGGEAELDLFPVIGARNSPWRLTPSYTLEYSGVNNVLQVDEDLFLFTQQLTQTVELGGAWRGDAYRRVNVGVFYEAFNGKLAADEPWFKGLYDYRDVGAEADWRTAWGSARAFSTTLGLRLTDRAYPNYVTLSVPEIHEKDSGIAKPWLGLDWKASEKVHVTADWSLQAVTYKEGLVVDDSGTTAAGVKRRDVVNTLSFGLPVKGGRQDWFLGYDAEIRASNYGDFDNTNFVLTPNYNDYVEHRLNASWAYGFEGPRWFLKAPQLSLDGRVTLRSYGGRLANDENGVPTANKEVDSSYWLSLGLNSPVNDHWSAYFSVDTSSYRSNNLDESTSLNNYAFTSIRLGGQFAY